MKRLSWILSILAVLLFATACERKTPAEKAADKVEEVGDKAEDAVDEAGNKTGDAVDKAGDKAEDVVDHTGPNE